MRDQLVAVETEFRAEIASMELPFAEVLGLRAGDVIRFDTPSSAGITMYADDRAMYRAQPGRSGNQRALQIVEKLEGQ